MCLFDKCVCLYYLIKTNTKKKNISHMHSYINLFKVICLGSSKSVTHTCRVVSIIQTKPLCMMFLEFSATTASLKVDQPTAQEIL